MECTMKCATLKAYKCCFECMDNTCQSRCKMKCKNYKESEDESMKVNVIRKVKEEIELKGGMVFEINGKMVGVVTKKNDNVDKMFYNFVSLERDETCGESLFYSSDKVLIKAYVENNNASFYSMLKDLIMPF